MIWQTSFIKGRRGVGLLTLVVTLSLISAMMVFTLLYLNFSYAKRTKIEIGSDKARCVYESAYLRAEYEILSNPEVFEKVNDDGKYEIADFSINGVTPAIRILPDNDGDGFLDIEIDIPST